MHTVATFRSGQPSPTQSQKQELRKRGANHLEDIDVETLRRWHASEDGLVLETT